MGDFQIWECSKKTLIISVREIIDLRTHVEELRTKVNSIGSDDRALEKAARNELGLAREMN